METVPLVSVVTVGWNHSHLLKGFVRSLEAETTPEWAERTEVIVVDNGSVDDTATFLADWQRTDGGVRWKRVLHVPDNLGYARGNNLGVGAARGDHLLLINNDVVFEGNAVEYCCRRFRETPRAILGRDLIWRHGRWNSLHGRAIPYLEGWCLFAGASLWRELGFWRDGSFAGVFDETFSPAFFEDVDLGLRASLKQIALRQVAIPVRHLGSRTTKMTPGFAYLRAIGDNHRRFVAKWGHLAGQPSEAEC